MHTYKQCRLPPVQKENYFWKVHTTARAKEKVLSSKKTLQIPMQAVHQVLQVTTLAERYFYTQANLKLSQPH